MSKSYEDPALEIVRIALERSGHDSSTTFQQEVDRLAEGYRRAESVMNGVSPDQEGSARHGW